MSAPKANGSSFKVNPLLLPKRPPAQTISYPNGLSFNHPQVENLNKLFNAFQAAQKDESKEYAKIRNIICQDQAKPDTKPKDAKKSARTIKKKSQMR